MWTTKAMRIVLTLIFLVSSTLAADKSAVARALAACGPSDIRFDVAVDENQHPVGQLEPEKALVYVVQDGAIPCILCSTTTRVGVDGTWVGANDGKSYFYFSVAPGEHHVCTDQQTKDDDHRFAALAFFIAEPGKTYYFRLRPQNIFTKDRAYLRALDLDPINNDEGQLLVASSKFSTWRVKK